MQSRTALSILVVSASLFASALAPRALGGQAAQKPPTGAAAADTVALYKKHCLVCHGADGDSKMPGMSFADGQWKHGSSVKEVSAVIHDGVKGTAMLPFKNKLNEAEIVALAKHVRAFDAALK